MELGTSPFGTRGPRQTHRYFVNQSRIGFPTTDNIELNNEEDIDGYVQSIVTAGVDASTPWSNPSPRSVAGFSQKCKDISQKYSNCGADGGADGLRKITKPSGSVQQEGTPNPQDTLQQPSTEVTEAASSTAEL